MRLLLTRAAEDAARTRVMLEAAGHRVMQSPVLVFQSFAPDWPGQAPQGIIATSPRAFAFGPLAAPEAAFFGNLPLFLVGTQTEAAARTMGFTGEARVGPDAAALLAMMRYRRSRRFFYLAGVERKPILEDGLEAQGHRVILLETYRAEPAAALTPEALAALEAGGLDGVLHYSRRSAEIFLALSASAALDGAGLLHFCLSRDVAAPLLAAGCRARVASTPDNEAMLAMVAAAV